MSWGRSETDRPVTLQRHLDAVVPDLPGAGEGWLEIAAVLEGTTHVSGIGWRLTTAAGPGPVRTATRRRGRTLLFAELAALRGGLSEAARAGVARLSVRVPTPALAALFAPAPGPRYPRARRAAEKLRPILGRFSEVRFAPAAPPDPELAHAVGEALDVGLHRAAESEEHRVRAMEQIVARAATVELTEVDGEWIANARYRVRLDPMHCDCPAWSARWARVPIAGRRAARLPCKHLVALALREGISVPSDLAELARRAPP